MRFYTPQQPFYCGIDLHAKTIYICIVDRSGKTLFHENLAVNADLNKIRREQWKVKEQWYNNPKYLNGNTFFFWLG